MNNRVLIGMVLGAVLGVAVVVPLHAGPGKPPEGSNPHKGKRTHESLVVPVSFPGGLTYSSKKWAACLSPRWMSTWVTAGSSAAGSSFPTRRACWWCFSGRWIDAAPARADRAVGHTANLAWWRTGHGRWVAFWCQWASRCGWDVTHACVGGVVDLCGDCACSSAAFGSGHQLV